jgi:hypothetical protein
VDNGRTDRQDVVVWHFDWSDCAGAAEYALVVSGASASIPLIAEHAISESLFSHSSCGGYVTGSNRFGWRWWVRARVNGVWGDWSQEANFDVEAVDSDRPRPCS